ncbi:MAG: hypothetical protein R8K49_01775 [Mariprofundaceae bacterium]
MAKYIDLLRSHQNEQNAPVEPVLTTRSTCPSSDCSDHLLADENLIIQPRKGNPQVDQSDVLLIDESPLAAETTANNVHPETAHLKTDVSTNQVGTGEHWLNICVQHTLDIFLKSQDKIPFNIKILSNFIGNLITDLSDDPDKHKINTLELHIAQNLRQISDQNEDLGGLVQKSVMMMLYAIKAGQRLKLSKDELRAHTLAAMLHHLGMAQVSSQIRHKKERLSKDEIQQIRLAPQYSYDYLELSGVTDPCILQTAAQASERYDGSGLLGLSGSDISWGARLVSVLSMFEALVHYRPYRKRLLPRDAIREIVKRHKQAFEQKMLKALIESISLYPVGTYVQLNSGDVGLVIAAHPRLPLRPEVYISLDIQGSAIPPRQVNLQKHPNLVVEKCMYEESLAELSGTHQQVPG